MAITTQAIPVVTAVGAETKLQWIFTTDPAEFRSRPVREGEVRVLDQSALFEEKQNRRTTFLVAQLEGQKIYTK